jgi:hypothetical protein
MALLQESINQRLVVRDQAEIGGWRFVVMAGVQYNRQKDCNSELLHRSGMKL